MADGAELLCWHRLSRFHEETLLIDTDTLYPPYYHYCHYERICLYRVMAVMAGRANLSATNTIYRLNNTPTGNNPDNGVGFTSALPVGRHEVLVGNSISGKVNYQTGEDSGTTKT